MSKKGSYNGGGTIVRVSRVPKKRRPRKQGALKSWLEEPFEKRTWVVKKDQKANTENLIIGKEKKGKLQNKQ